VIYCESQSDYDQALLSLWNLKEPERIAIARASENYIEHFFSSTAISRSLNEALD
jgi:hypothetical protein